MPRQTETPLTAGAASEAPSAGSVAGGGVAVKPVALAVITPERERAIESGHSRLLAEAQDLVVDSPEAEADAWTIVNGIGRLKKMIEADFAGPKTAAHAAHKAVLAQEKAHLDRLDQPDQIVRAKLVPWEQEKRRLQAEAERKAREETDRVNADLRDQAEKKERAAAEERQLAAAQAAEAVGDTAKAEELLNAPVEVGPVVVPEVVVPVLSAPRVAGAGAMVTVWNFEIVDPQAIPRQYLTVDESAIRKVVQALKEQANIPGVRVYSVLEARRTGGRR